jgi:hypothetical protein
LLEDPHVTVGEVVGDLYEMRNFIAHGDWLPDQFFADTRQRDFSGAVPKWEVLTGAASFIIRISLLKILHDGLLDHFADAEPAEAFFTSQGLTKDLLRRRRSNSDCYRGLGQI